MRAAELASMALAREADDAAQTAAVAQLRFLDPRESDNYNDPALWLGTPFTDTDWSNQSAIVSFLRKQAAEAARRGKHDEAIGFTELADRAVRTRKKIQARIAHRNGQ